VRQEIDSSIANTGELFFNTFRATSDDFDSYRERWGQGSSREQHFLAFQLKFCMSFDFFFCLGFSALVCSALVGGEFLHARFSDELDRGEVGRDRKFKRAGFNCEKIILVFFEHQNLLKTLQQLLIINKPS
jgi:hypothetical protein